MRRVSILLALLLVIGACGDDDATDPTSPASTPATVSTEATTAPPTVTVSTAAQVPQGPTDCLEIWPEAVVQTITASDLTFFEANADRSACVYLGLPNSVALGWRTGDLIDFEVGKSGAGAVSGAADIAVCDTGYFSELAGAGVIMEAHSAGQGRTYTATVTGLSIDDARDWAAALIGSAC
jgi:hypothetical protein